MDLLTVGRQTQAHSASRLYVLCALLHDFRRSLTSALEAQGISTASRGLQRPDFGGRVRVNYPPKRDEHDGARCRLRAGDEIARPTSSSGGDVSTWMHGIYLGDEQVRTEYAAVHYVAKGHRDSIPRDPVGLQVYQGQGA